jgi:hypothetical protein
MRRYPGLTAVPVPVARNTSLLAAIWAMAAFHGRCMYRQCLTSQPPRSFVDLAETTRDLPSTSPPPSPLLSLPLSLSLPPTPSPSPSLLYPDPTAVASRYVKSSAGQAGKGVGSPSAGAAARGRAGSMEAGHGLVTKRQGSVGRSLHKHRKSMAAMKLRRAKQHALHAAHSAVRFALLLYVG